MTEPWTPASSENDDRVSNTVARCVRARPEGAVLAVRVAPKSGVNQVGRVEVDVVRVQVTAAAADGAANAALLRLLADAVDVQKSTVEIISGRSAGRKRVLFRGLAAAELAQRLSSPGNGEYG